MRLARERGKLQGSGIHVGDAVVAIECAECNGYVLQRFAGKLARAVDLEGQRRFLFGSLMTHTRHFQLRIDAGNELASGEGLGEVVICAGFDALNASFTAGVSR